MLPWFAAVPPSGFGVLTTTGRKSAKRRRLCVRAIRRGDRVYLVSIGGERAGWVRNIDANPRVRLRLAGGTFDGPARKLTDMDELRAARSAYCGTVNRVDYLECALHTSGRASRAKIGELHRKWFDRGPVLVVELDY
jgi:deazaflavin-dependent oxidoreductase (nitroreductase family)